MKPTYEDLVSSFFVTAVAILLGAPVGLLWAALAPHARIDITAAGATFADGASEVFVAADGWFLGITLLAGILLGLLTWLLARGSGPYVVVGLAVGGLVAAYVASKVGMRPHQDALRDAAAAGQQGRYVANVALQAWQVLLAWPIAALGAFLTLVAARPDEVA
ncbi:MAG: hypothetical protein LC789_14050 [Actinobacteria bacterium]|nr:hypothetical protein [Actinomycetota bacterium]MCA1720769.1 hypothetical protein [Actinomycetota bacterium]